MIIPRELGYITIKATANSILAGDSVNRKLLVKVSYISYNFLYSFSFIENKLYHSLYLLLYQLKVNLNFFINVG